MSGASRPVASPQSGPHPRLVEVVRRHLAMPSRAPVPAHTREAFEQVAARRAREPTWPIVLDSGCGTGASTRALAITHPEAWVVGIDRSAARLARGPLASPAAMPPNLVLARAEAAAFWRLARAAGWRLRRHWLLYPNPWPKPEHLMRRWHGHPAFADLLALGGEIRLRTNWRVYAEEFALALGVAGNQAALIHLDADAPPMSPFEAKYLASAQVLIELRAAPASADR
jgi:tRNA G46 methylase TrmB